MLCYVMILIKYINIFDNCHSTWKCFFDFHLSKFAGKLGFTGNLSRKDAKSLAVKENFLQELIELLTDLSYRDSFASLAEFNAEGIWNNSLRLESQARLSFIRNGLMQEYRILMMFWQLIPNFWDTAVLRKNSAQLFPF